MDYQQKYQKAKEAGYPEEEIIEYFSTQDPEFMQQLSQAEQAGYTKDEVFNYLRGQPKQEEDKGVIENTQRAIGRQVARGGAMLATGLAGSFGDLANLGSRGLEAVGAISPESGEKFRERTLTTSKIREGLQEELPYLKPENEYERFADDTFETLGSLINPLGKANTAANLTRKFALSVGANLGKEIVDQTAGEKDSEAGQYVKAGTLFLGSLINPKLAASEASKRYKEAEKLLPNGAQVSSRKMFRELDAIEKRVTAGRPRSSLSSAEKFVLDKIDRLKGLSKNGFVNIKQLVAQKRSLNEELDNLFPTFGKTGAKTIKNQAKNVNKTINNSLKEYGTSNPEYFKNLKSGDSIYSTIERSKEFANWVKREFPHSPWSRAGLLFSDKVLGSPVKMLYKAWASPEIRNLYIKALSKAAAEDSREFSKVMDQLDKKLKEQESEQSV